MRFGLVLMVWFSSPQHLSSFKPLWFGCLAGPAEVTTPATAARAALAAEVRTVTLEKGGVVGVVFSGVNPELSRVF